MPSLSTTTPFSPLATAGTSDSVLAVDYAYVVRAVKVKDKQAYRLTEVRGSVEYKKVKASHTRYRALGPELIPVYRQSARR